MHANDGLDALRRKVKKTEILHHGHHHGAGAADGGDPVSILACRLTIFDFVKKIENKKPRYHSNSAVLQKIMAAATEDPKKKEFPDIILLQGLLKKRGERNNQQCIKPFASIYRTFQPPGGTTAVLVRREFYRRVADVTGRVISD